MRAACDEYFSLSFLFVSGSPRLQRSYSHANLPSKLLKQMEKAWRADIGYW